MMEGDTVENCKVFEADYEIYWKAKGCAKNGKGFKVPFWKPCKRYI